MKLRTLQKLESRGICESEEEDGVGDDSWVSGLPDRIKREPFTRRRHGEESVEWGGLTIRFGHVVFDGLMRYSGIVQGSSEGCVLDTCI